MDQSHRSGASAPVRDAALRAELQRAHESHRRLIEALQFAISGFAVVEDVSIEQDVKRLAAINIRSLQEAIAAAARWIL